MRRPLARGRVRDTQNQFGPVFNGLDVKLDSVIAGNDFGATAVGFQRDMVRPVAARMLTFPDGPKHIPLVKPEIHSHLRMVDGIDRDPSVPFAETHFGKREHRFRAHKK